MFIWDFVASAVMSELLDWAYSQVVGFLGNFFGIMGNMGVELFELPWVQALVLFFNRLGWGLFAASLVVVGFEFAMEYVSGRGNLHQTGVNILKGFMAVCLFTTVPVRLYAYSVTLQVSFTNGITGFGSIGELGQDLIARFTTPEGFAETALGALLGGSDINIVMMLFCVILMAYAVIKVFFANLKRGGILLIQIAVGSLYMFSVPRGYTDGFLSWCRQIIALCVTSFLQVTILVAGLMVVRDNALLGLGLMLSAGEVPRIAGAFGLDTSAKVNLSSAVYTAQSAINTTRTIIHAAQAL